jgi:hypothetical protein
MLDMANRLRQTRDSMVSVGSETSGPPSTGAMAFQGDIAHMSLATVLTLLELERRSGRLKVTNDKDRTATLELAEGAFASATLDGKAWQPTDFLREVLRWKRGLFAFRASKIDAPRGTRQAIGHLLLEAMRLEDEASNKK